MSKAASTALRFSKMHGAGNDFVVLDLRDGTPEPTPALAAQLANRHTGVGCDQILTIEPPRAEGSVAAYRIWNADGSQSEQCGNGARCVAAWLVRDGAATGDTFAIDSPLATHTIERIGDDQYAVAMGVPRFEPQQIPLLGFARAREEYLLPLQGDTVRFGAVSMGNPHAVIEVGLVDA
ncbi:MAG: diaminopimelate epimerase, partial [Stenotrophomonas sp.]